MIAGKWGFQNERASEGLTSKKKGEAPKNSKAPERRGGGPGPLREEIGRGADWVAYKLTDWRMEKRGYDKKVAGQASGPKGRRLNSVGGKMNVESLRKRHPVGKKKVGSS